MNTFLDYIKIRFETIDKNVNIKYIINNWIYDEHYNIIATINNIVLSDITNCLHPFGIFGIIIYKDAEYTFAYEP